MNRISYLAYEFQCADYAEKILQRAEEQKNLPGKAEHLGIVCKSVMVGAFAVGDRILAIVTALFNKTSVQLEVILFCKTVGWQMFRISSAAIGILLPSLAFQGYLKSIQWERTFLQAHLSQVSQGDVVYTVTVYSAAPDAYLGRKRVEQLDPKSELSVDRQVGNYPWWKVKFYHLNPTQVVR